LQKKTVDTNVEKLIFEEKGGVVNLSYIGSHLGLAPNYSSVSDLEKGTRMEIKCNLTNGNGKKRCLT
jgi:hypothetical protein